MCDTGRPFLVLDGQNPGHLRLFHTSRLRHASIHTATRNELTSLPPERVSKVSFDSSCPGEVFRFLFWFGRPCCAASGSVVLLCTWCHLLWFNDCNTEHGVLSEAQCSVIWNHACHSAVQDTGSQQLGTWLSHSPAHEARPMLATYTKRNMTGEPLPYATINREHRILFPP